jgi:hypothetical protein
MTGELSKNFHGVGIGPLSKILDVKITAMCITMELRNFLQKLADRFGFLVIYVHYENKDII